MRYMSLAVVALAASSISPALSAPTRYGNLYSDLDVFHARASSGDSERKSGAQEGGATRKWQRPSDKPSGPRVRRPPANPGSTSVQHPTPAHAPATASSFAPGRPPQRSDSVSSDSSDSTIKPPTPKASKPAPLEPEYAPERRDRVDKGEAGEELSTSRNFALRAFGGLGASGNLAGVPKDVSYRQEMIPADATLTSTVGKRHVAQGDNIMAYLISRMLNELD